MVSHTRRSVLRTGCTAAIAGTAGCTEVFGGPDATAPQLGELLTKNFDDRTHAVHVAVDLEGETVYRDTKRLEAAPENDSVGAIFTDFPREPAPYVVYAWKDDEPRRDAQQLDFSDFDTECLGLQLVVGYYGMDPAEDPHLSIYHTTNPNACS